MKKTLSFAVIHFTIAFSVAYILTGDVLIGSLIAMLEPTINTGAFYLHEKVWQKVTWLKHIATLTSIKTISFMLVHFSVAFGVVYWLTGNWLAGGILALIEPSLNSVAYYLHEKVWLKYHPFSPSLT